MCFFTILVPGPPQMPISAFKFTHRTNHLSHTPSFWQYKVSLIFNIWRICQADIFKIHGRSQMQSTLNLVMMSQFSGAFKIQLNYQWHCGSSCNAAYKTCNADYRHHLRHLGAVWKRAGQHRKRITVSKPKPISWMACAILWMLARPDVYRTESWTLSFPEGSWHHHYLFARLYGLEK